MWCSPFNTGRERIEPLSSKWSCSSSPEASAKSLAFGVMSANWPIAALAELRYRFPDEGVAHSATSVVEKFALR